MTVAQSHTILTSPVSTRVKISELEEEAALLIILQCKIHCSYIDHTVNCFYIPLYLLKQIKTQECIRVALSPPHVKHMKAFYLIL